METVPATRGRSQAALGDSRLKRVFAIWSLLFFKLQHGRWAGAPVLIRRHVLTIPLVGSAVLEDVLDWEKSRWLSLTSRLQALKHSWGFELVASLPVQNELVWVRACEGGAADGAVKVRHLHRPLEFSQRDLLLAPTIAASGALAARQKAR